MQPPQQHQQQHGQLGASSGGGGGGRMSSNTLLLEFFPTLAMMAVSLLVGYVCARTRLTAQVELQGLAKVIGLFCLPALLFKTLAETDLRAVEWRFVGGMGLAKAIVFMMAIGLTVVGERRRGKLGAGRQWIEAGLRGIMATQSNDYAFGAPILAALYAESHPEFLPLIYLLAPISLVILNPLAFVLCELGLVQEKQSQPPSSSGAAEGDEQPPPRRSRSSPSMSDDEDEGEGRPLATAAAAASSSSSSSLASGDGAEESDGSSGGGGGAGGNVTYWRGAPLVLFYGDGDRTARGGGGAKEGGSSTEASDGAAKAPSSSVWGSVLRQVASNPVVVMTFLGLVTGAGLQGKGLPPVLAKVLQGWADLFPVGALFLMGANMHGAVSLADDRTYLFMVVLVLAAKLLLVPLLAYLLTSALGGSTDLAILAFIIGAFPVAPTVSIYGLRYAAPASRASAPGGFVQATDQASLAAAVVLSTLAALPILLIAVLALEIQEQHSGGSDSGGDGQKLFDDAIYYIQIATAIPAAWALLCLTLQAATARPRRRHPHKPHPLPPRHYPILALATCCLGRAVVGAACHDAAAGAGRFAFWYLLFDVGAQVATVWAALGGARLVQGRRAHLLALAATAALAIVLAGVATHMTKDNNSSSSSDAHASTCTPIQSTALDGFLAPLSGACAAIALLALFVYPVWRDRRGGQRRQQQQDRATLPSGALEPLLEGGGAGTDLPQPRQQGQQQQPQGAGLPSRRLKLLVAFSALTMLLGCGRCLLRLTRHIDDPFSYLAFIDAALAALLAPVLCCLYALERDLYVYHVLRWGFRRVGRWCLGGGWGAKRREEAAT